MCIDCVLYFKDEGAFYDELNTVSQLLTEKKCSKDVKIKKPHGFVVNLVFEIS